RNKSQRACRCVIDVGAVAPTAEKKADIGWGSRFFSARFHTLGFNSRRSFRRTQKIDQSSCRIRLLRGSTKPCSKYDICLQFWWKRSQKLDTLGRENIADYAYSSFHFATI